MRVPALSLLAFALFSSLACQNREESPAVWFVHATDPHLFEKPDNEKQEPNNKEAFEAMLKALNSLPGTGIKPSFLVLTGDFGIAEEAKKEDCNAADLALKLDVRAKRIESLARILAGSPVREIYLVPGNNDVWCERASDDALAATGAFLQEVGRKLDGKVVLHDLSACYLSTNSNLSQCWADVPGTSFRLVGFPSYSFKKGLPKQGGDSKEIAGKAVEVPGSPVDAASPAPARDDRALQVEKFASLVRQANADGKKVLVLSHIPDLDDPYEKAQESFKEDKNGVSTGWPTWKIDPKILDAWRVQVGSDTVAGVLAGHFHDSHRELYEHPYRWSIAYGTDPAKIFLAPPLAMRNQNTSPLQARGFSLVRLAGDQLTRRLYWYDQNTSVFTPEPEPPQSVTNSLLARMTGGLWEIGSDKGNLARAAIVAIAFLAALLTVIATWDIPPGHERLPSAVKTEKPAPAPEPAKSGGGIVRSLAAPFQGNFATTVLSGLGGMAAVSFVDDSFWKDAGISPKSHYLVLFVVFFFVILLASALYQGATEALRSRVVLVHRPPQWQPRGKSKSAPRQYALYWGRRLWGWLLSWRHSFLLFADTFFNVVQGRNQLQTAGYAKAVSNLHWAQYRVAERVRQSIDQEISRAILRENSLGLLKQKGVGPPKEDSDVRVNVGLLSEDGSSVSYLSWERGSLGKPFGKRSVAWISIASGNALWYKKNVLLREQPDKEVCDKKEIYDKDTILLENRDGELPVESPLRLGENYQLRPSPDYEAFVILPAPWVRRSQEGEYQKAGILISFRKAAYMDALWEGLEFDDKPNYAAWRGLLECPPEPSSERDVGGVLLTLSEMTFAVLEAPSSEAKEISNCGRLYIRDPNLQAVLHEGLEVLGEALRYFSPTVFEEQILPYIQT
ncbi:MAG TPA: metallophosphoesterase [Thermoanaerobaculia bacterium]|jgi:hypothetical protein